MSTEQPLVPPVKSNMDVHFSSASSEWSTPCWLFDQLNTEFSFDLDAAASDANYLVSCYYTAAQDALKQSWGEDGEVVWCNPPYGRLGPKFMRYAHSQTVKYPHLTVVMLVPARPDTRVWHDCAAMGEVRFIKGRLKFVNKTLPSYREDGNFKLSPAPFPSAIVVFGAKACRLGGATKYVTYREPKSLT